MIRINSEFYIDSDSYGYSLKKRNVNEEGKETYAIIGFFPTVSQCVEKAMRIKQREICQKDLSLVGALHEMERINKEMKDIIKGIEKKEKLK